MCLLLLFCFRCRLTSLASASTVLLPSAPHHVLRRPHASLRLQVKAFHALLLQCCNYPILLMLRLRSTHFTCYRFPIARARSVREHTALTLDQRPLA